MPELNLQLDEELLDRLRSVAQVRRCSVEALIAHLLQELLPVAPPAAEPSEIGTTATHWNHEEAAFLKDAALAFDDIPVDEALAGNDSTEWDKGLS